jgi:L,D-transpeptidase ErfK/SrfK
VGRNIEDGRRRAAGALSLFVLVLASLFVDSATSARVPEGQRPPLVGAVAEYAARLGDTLVSVGARHGAGVSALARDNGLATDAKLAVGQWLRIDNRHIAPASLDAGTLIINVPQRMLFYGADDDGLEGYPVAVGQSGWRTPTREFVVVMKEREPTWDVPASILEESRRQGRRQAARVPPGPNNPLGAFWIGLSLSGIGIHGTNAPSSIFRAATHGCIRMHPDDIARLFPRISVGTRGRTIYEPVLVALQDGAVYLEVHPDVYRRDARPARIVARALADGAGLTEWIDWSAADVVAAAREGIARDVTRPSPRP